MPTRHSIPSALTHLMPGEAFPAASSAWDAKSAAPGLLAVGADLTTHTLLRAYQAGIFPWFSAEDPILWWSPNPRMVLHTAEFQLHRSLRKTLQRFSHSAHCELRFDSQFETVIQACASSVRNGQRSTWIVPSMVQAYTALHHAGYAHSVETWIDGALVGGLYCIAIGKAVFGESMFSTRTDSSKIALAALVAFCRHHGVQHIDCQQNTRHLASLGAREIPRADFLKQVQQATQHQALHWQFSPLYWQNLLNPPL